MKLELNSADLMAFAEQLSTPILKVVEEKINKSNAVQQENKNQDWMRSEDVMGILGIQQTALNKITQSEALPCYKTGKRLLFKRSEVYAYIENHKVIKAY